MTSDVAAAYMGISKTTFLDRFGARGVKEGGNTLWARAQLDRIVVEQFDLAPAILAAADDPYEEWKRGRERR
ncbi:hypothetical protein ASG07_11935 [Sphingomonas sp. Leaf343]|nr:hypothetical protein ASG07_11935 [Sphingomonas sp. Leaf343]